MVNRLVQVLERLTPWERRFILNIKKWQFDEDISEKQHDTIATIFRERLVQRKYRPQKPLTTFRIRSVDGIEKSR